MAHQHNLKRDRYDNMVCRYCLKIFVRNEPEIPGYVLHRTDADRDI